MRIIHLLKHAVRGNGSVHMAVDLACAQADAGHEVWFASARGSYDDLLRAHGVTVRPLPEPTSALAAIANARALFGLLRETKPDIVHAHMMSSAVIAFPLVAVSRATLVTTMHNSFDSHSWMMRAGKRVVAVSEAERTLLLSRGYRPGQVTTVLNGTAGTPRAELATDDVGKSTLARPTVMTLSGLHHRKAVDDVIRAFAQVAAEFPAWHLTVVGWGAERENLERQAKEAGLWERVRFLGSTMTPAPLLAQADIVATASLADPCPLTVMEARVAGCAVVGTTVGGIPEVLAHGEAGLLVPPRTPDAMAAAFRDLMGSSDSLTEWRARALEGSDYFSTARMASDYDAVYLATLPARRRAQLTSPPVVTP